MRPGQVQLRNFLFSEGYIVDWLFAGIVILITYTVPNSKQVPTIHRMEQEKDPALSYPHVSGTVSGVQLAVITCIVPVAVFTIMLVVRRSWIDWHHACLSLVEGFAVTYTWKNWMNIVGRHRPDWYARVAGNGSMEDGMHSYPSGHAAYSFLGMTLVSCYLIGKFQLFSRPSKGCFAKVVLALAPVAFATYVACTRVVDYRHNFSDINAGSFIGFISGLFAYFLNFNSFFSANSHLAKTEARDGWLAGLVPPPAPVSHEKKGVELAPGVFPLEGGAGSSLIV